MAEILVTVAARTDTGPVRKNNEDAFRVVELDSGAVLEGVAGSRVCRPGSRGVLLALSDGMGGSQAGEVASALSVERLAAALLAAPDAVPPERRLLEAVRGANAEVVRAARVGSRRGMGATLTAVVVHDGMALLAQVGDSRAYALRSGILQQVTRDQSLVQALVDSGTLTPEQARTSSRKNVILQALGRSKEVLVALGRLQLRQGDRLLLCCDGLSNTFEHGELARLLSDGDPAAACDRLIEQAISRGADDNVTAVVAHVEGKDLPPARADEPPVATLDVLRDWRS